MVFQRIISRFPGRSRISGQPQRLYAQNCNPFVKFSDQSPKPLSQITQKRDLFSGSLTNNDPTRILHNVGPSFLGKSGLTQANSIPSSLNFTSSIHSVGQKEFEKNLNNGPVDPEKNTGFINDSNRTQRPVNMGPNARYFENFTKQFAAMDRTGPPTETGRFGRPFTRDFGPSESGTGRSMNFFSGIIRDNNQNENYRSGIEQNADIVHIKIMRNNTFVTVTDSKGNKKMGASAGSLAEMKGGPKVSKYSAEATAEHVGRVAKSMGLKSVVMKVNGFTFFKKKKLAILSFRDGYTHSRSDRNPIVYIEDTTRKPHNGCRLRKQRRV